MESKEDLEELAKLFSININVRTKSTQSFSEQLNWGDKERKIVEKLYKEDFKRFGYKKINAN